jgi:hypothetical protein
MAKKKSKKIQNVGMRAKNSFKYNLLDQGIYNN